MQIITKVLSWLILSSQDENKLSATFKGSIVFTVVTALAAVLHVSGLNEATDSLVNFIVELGRIIAAIYALYGAVRKVNRTLGGTNAVLNSKTL